MNHLELARMGTAARVRHATERAESYRWFIEKMARAGLSYGSMSRSLEAYRIKTPSGRGRWHKEMVRRIVIRLGLRPLTHGE